jgi:hypothetical protein
MQMSMRRLVSESSRRILAPFRNFARRRGFSPSMLRARPGGFEREPVNGGSRGRCGLL